MYILGAGGFAREVALVLQEQGIKVDGYLSDNPAEWNKPLVFGKVRGSIETVNAEWLESKIIGTPTFIPGVGSPEARERLVQRCLALGWNPAGFTKSPKVMMPTSFIAADIKVGIGTIFCSGVSGTVNLSIGNWVNINLNCTLGHDCVLEDFVNLSPDVNISGYAHLEESVDVGTGAVIGPKVRIGRRAVIGAGSTVLKDVPAGEVWVGSPAKFLRTIG